MVEKAALDSCPKSLASKRDEADIGSAIFRAIEAQSAASSSELKICSPSDPSGTTPERRAISALMSSKLRWSTSRFNRTSTPPEVIRQRLLLSNEKLTRRMGRDPSRARSNNVGQRAG